MTRLELLTLVVSRARSNGFELRRWYTGRLGLPWISAEAALTLLDGQRRYYALLFSHEFAQAFWKAGSDITFEVPATSFQRPMPDGTLRTVTRKGYIRRSLRPDVWRYHLQGMALAEEPLRYLRRYMHIEEDLETEVPSAAKPALEPLAKAPKTHKTLTKSSPATKIQAAGTIPLPQRPPARPLPTEKPAFLKRPYKGSLPN